MNEKHMRTRLVHAGENELAKKIASSVSVPKVLPIYMSSVFSFDDVPSLDAVYAGDASGYVYSRMTNPSTDAVEEILAAAEGADGALVFASGHGRHRHVDYRQCEKRRPCGVLSGAVWRCL